MKQIHLRRLALAPVRQLLLIAMVAAAVVMAFSGCRGGGASPGQSLSFSGTTLSGQRFSTEDHRGKVLLINFFATWCKPCNQEMPELISLYQQYNPQGLQMVAVGADPGEATQRIQEFAATHAIPFPVIPPDEQILSAVGGIRVYPTTLILDQQGVIRHKIIGVRIKEMEQAVKALLAEKQE